MTPIKRYLIDLFSYSQAMIFVIFARKFINLKKYHPTAFRVTNIYLAWYLLHFIIFQQFNIDIGLKTIWYSLIFFNFFNFIHHIYLCNFAVKKWYGAWKIFYYWNASIFCF